MLLYHSLQLHDWVFFSSYFHHLISASVRNTGIGHGVSVVSICIGFDEERTMFGAILFSKLHGCHHGENVHTVDLESWYGLVSIIKARVGCVSLDCGSHGISVVFTKHN